LPEKRGSKRQQVRSQTPLDSDQRSAKVRSCQGGRGGRAVEGGGLEPVQTSRPV